MRTGGREGWREKGRRGEEKMGEGELTVVMQRLKGSVATDNKPSAACCSVFPSWLVHNLNYYSNLACKLAS